MTSTFQQTRAQALTLENKTQAALNAYSSFAQSTSSSATADELQAERSVEKLLQQTDETLQKLTVISEQDLTLPASKLQQLQRQKEIYQQQVRDFQSIRTTIRDERNRMNLLFNIRNDIDLHQQQEQQAQRPYLQNEDDYIQQERQRAEQSNNIVDRLISDALQTRDIFSRQSSTLQSARVTLTNGLSSVPGINTLIKKINTRKKRDSVILAALITSMIILLWFIT